jgi:hypothetical protein
MRAKTGTRKLGRRGRGQGLLQRGGAAIEMMMTQFIAGATRIAPVAFAMGYKMYKSRGKTRRVKMRRK